jgi:ParB family chromosome partitioning protein
MAATCKSDMETALLDPGLVVASRWANRHPQTYADRAFETLKREIAQAGGNVQAIKVRKAEGGKFEIVFGHRRHRACQELGLPVLAVVVPEMDECTLWQEMERENRARQDLSPFEQGRHYRVALDAGLYPSIRRLAEAIGVDISQAAKVIRIADLPEEVLGAFNSPCDIQVNWSTKLSAAIERDPEGIRKKAKALTASGEKKKPKQVFEALTGSTQAEAGVEPFHTPMEITNAKSGAKATIAPARGGYSVRITGGISAAELEAAVRRLLKA